MKSVKQGFAAAVLAAVGVAVLAGPARAEVDLQSLLREGLLGAGVGALSAGVGKGNAGTGALVGAGTQIIGGSLLSFLTAPSSGQGRTVYTQQQAVAAQPVYYTQPQPVYVQPAYSDPVYTYAQPSVPAYSYGTGPAAQSDSGKMILKQGLLGAGVGALSAGVGKGNAGTGALVGAGTSVIGGALLEFLSAPAGTSPAPAQPSSNLTHRRIVRTYDAGGNVVKEEEFWQ